MKTVLVIEDDSACRQVITLALREAGLAVLEAENGVEGVRLARQHSPDLVVSDVKMELMDGRAVLAALRSDPTVAMIPVILITGQPQETTVRESMSLGADDYLAKPFAVADLLDTVRARIAKSELVRRLAEQKLEALRANLRTSLPHELLTPLTGIIAGAEIIRSDYRALGPEEVTRFADMIAQSARRLLKLVHNYIEYAELEILAADPGQLETLRRQLIAFSKELIAKAAGEKARQYDRTLDLDLRLCESPAGVGDQALREIVDQLVDNAFKFSEPGEGVTVESVREGAELVLRVRDRGSGMTPEQIAIVGAGVQFDRTRREQQGLGLGLALVRRLVEVHGGTCRIRSEPKVFTEVEVRLRTSV